MWLAQQHRGPSKHQLLRHRAICHQRGRLGLRHLRGTWVLQRCQGRPPLLGRQPPHRGCLHPRQTRAAPTAGGRRRPQAQRRLGKGRVVAGQPEISARMVSSDNLSLRGTKFFFITIRLHKRPQYNTITTLMSQWSFASFSFQTVCVSSSQRISSSAQTASLRGTKAF